MNNTSSIEANISKNGNVDSGIRKDTDSVERIEKQIISKNNTTHVLIEKENSDDYSLSVSDFRINDSKILSLLNRQYGSNYYSFSGLMRKLNIHQQSLTRALNRLQGLELIDRTSMGYKLTKNAILLLSKPNFDLSEQREGNNYIHLLQTYIPANIKTNEVVSSLIGKWFNNLRWLGMIEGERGYILQWLNEDDDYNNSFQVNLKIVSDYIVIETNAVSEKQKIEAMVGSFRMLQHIIKLFQDKIGVLDEYIISLNKYPSNKNN